MLKVFQLPSLLRSRTTNRIFASNSWRSVTQNLLVFSSMKENSENISSVTGCSERLFVSQAGSGFISWALRRSCEAPAESDQV